MKQKEANKDIYDDLKLGKNPLFSMVCTQIFQHCRVNATGIWISVSTLVQHCTNVIQMFSVYWVAGRSALKQSEHRATW